MEGRLHDKVCNDINGPSIHFEAQSGHSVHGDLKAPVYTRSHHLRMRDSAANSAANSRMESQADSQQLSAQSARSHDSGTQPRLGSPAESGLFPNTFEEKDAKEKDLEKDAAASGLAASVYEEVGFKLKKRAGSLVGEYYFV